VRDRELSPRLSSAAAALQRHPVSRERRRPSPPPAARPVRPTALRRDPAGGETAPGGEAGAAVGPSDEARILGRDRLLPGVQLRPGRRPDQLRLHTVRHQTPVRVAVVTT